MNIIVPRFPAARKQISEIGLCGWVGQAAPGDALEYHRGFLALDTERRGSKLAERDRAELVRVARRVWWAAEQGLVHLLQRRNGADDFTYIAIARPKPKQASLSLSKTLPKEVA